jgi:hypothetical protein
MEVEQMMAQMLDKMKAEIRTNQAKMEATLKEVRAGQELLKEEMLAKINASQEQTKAKMDARLAEMKGVAKGDVGLPRSDRSLSGE